jgi:YVTN family beta-propeller protein
VHSITAVKPIGLVNVDGQAWVVDAGAGTVGPVDTLGSAAVKVGGTPLRAAYDGKLVWVTLFGAGQVVAIDPTSRQVVRRVHLGGQPEGIAAAYGHIWVVRQQAKLLTELTSAGHVVRSVPVGTEPRLVIAADKRLFVSDYAGGRVYKIKPSSDTVASSVRLCKGAQDMAAVGYYIWASCTSGNAIAEFNPGSMRRTTVTSPVPQPDAIASVGSLVYIACTKGPVLQVFQQDQSNAPVGPFSLGSDPALSDSANVDLLVIGKQFWVTSPNGGRIISGMLPATG